MMLKFSNNQEKINHALHILERDELVAIPTETVYGLAANAYSDKAIEKIFKLKNRPQTNPLIVHINSLSQIDDIAKNIPKKARLLAKEFWPGPLTLVLEKQDGISSLLTANLNTVGVRVPDHPLTTQLLGLSDFPLVAPSANRSNHISPTLPSHIKTSFGDSTPFILDGGPCDRGVESTIVGFEGGNVVIYRHGAITKEMIGSFLKSTIYEQTQSKKPKSPGMFSKHYAPKTKLIFTDDLYNTLKNCNDVRVGLLMYSELSHIVPFQFQRILSENNSLTEAAKNLYKYLYELDLLDLDLIIAEKLPNQGLGLAINDKLKRASFS